MIGVLSILPSGLLSAVPAILVGVITVPHHAFLWQTRLQLGSSYVQACSGHEILRTQVFRMILRAAAICPIPFIWKAFSPKTLSLANSLLTPVVMRDYFETS